MIDVLNSAGNRWVTMRTIFVGDVHGCATELQELLTKVSFNPSADRLLWTGDAFSKGPEPMEVWKLIRQLQPNMVLGNHDDHLMRQLRKHRDSHRPSFKHAEQELLFTTMLPQSSEVLDWLESLPLFVDEDEFLLVHAGINPEFGLRGTSRKEFLTIRTWPPTDSIEGSRWHDAYDHPTRQVLVFGHDAPMGLVARRDPANAMRIVGLDSGCVYGGQLSAFILEEECIVQVNSGQPNNFDDR